MSMWRKLAVGIKPTTREVTDELYELCDNLHSSDCVLCPVYEARNGDINRKGSRAGCDAFKSGPTMLAVIRETTFLGDSDLVDSMATHQVGELSADELRARADWLEAPP